MNNDKAREFFSSYFEGTLEQGLKQSLERQFNTDSELKGEYRHFERTLGQLSDLKLEDIPVPADLHETIATRLDRHIYEQKRTASTGFTGLWRNLSLGAIGLAAIVGAVYSIPHLGTKGAAGIIAGEPQKQVAGSSHIDFKAQPNSVLVEINPSTERTLTIESDGKVLKRLLAKSGEQSSTPLVNQQLNAAAMCVTVQGDPTQHFVALPGRVANTERVGQGDLVTFAKAVAGYYQRPVLLEVSDTKQVVHWSFVATEPLKATMDALADSHLSVEQRDGKLVTIADR